MRFMKNRKGGSGALVFAIAIAGAVAVVGCAGMNQLAPPVDDAMIQLGAIDGVTADQIQRGRHLYITSCTRCHSPEPVTRYTPAEWDEILPRMSEEAALDDIETADVASYVHVALQRSGPAGALSHAP